MVVWWAIKDEIISVMVLLGEYWNIQVEKRVIFCCELKKANFLAVNGEKKELIQIILDSERCSDNLVNFEPWLIGQLKIQDANERKLETWA